MPTKSIPLTDRFWPKVNKRGHDECWPWLGANIRGRGVMRLRTRNYLAPRVCWEMHYGPIPVGLWVLHSCDNPACVNPLHLFLGDRRRNIADCVSKRRHAHGTKHGNCKIAPERVAAIRNAEGSQYDIAALFGISQSHVSEIKSGKKRAYG